jgi:hypothetical protein
MSYQVKFENMLEKVTVEYSVYNETCIFFADDGDSEYVDFWCVERNSRTDYANDDEPFFCESRLYSLLDEQLADKVAYAMACGEVGPDYDEVLVETVFGQLDEAEIDRQVDEVARLVDKYGASGAGKSVLRNAAYTYHTVDAHR